MKYLGVGGACIKGIKGFFPWLVDMLREQPFDMIYLELGSNDLDSREDPTRLAEELAVRVDYVILEFGIPVVIAHAIPRDERKFPGSKARTDRFNEFLNVLAVTRPKVHIWHPRALAQYSRLLSRDGVHLNEKGAIKYHHNVRAAIRYYRHKLF